MSFKFAGRTLLELGKELISSDEVALYELIKNAVDAESPQVEIAMHVQTLYSDYRKIITLIEQGSKDEALDLMRRKIRSASATDSSFRLLGIRSASSRHLLLNEVRALYNRDNYIEIRDTGHGMSLSELTDIFLHIGTRSRRKENVDGAQYLGDKGIGRLSAMRLGDRMQVKTARVKDRFWNILNIDWSLFTHDNEVEIDEVNIEPEIGDEKSIPDEHGTTIRIMALQYDWDIARFTDMLQGKIARMVDPFESGLANRLIVARYNGARVRVPSIPRSLLRAAHAVCHVRFYMDGGTPVIAGEVDYRYRHRKSVIHARGAEVGSLVQNPVKRRAKRGHAAYLLVPIPNSAFKQLGDFTCDIFWYNRRVVKAIDGLTYKPNETRREIQNWSGGPMLFRNGFRILPYGSPGDDWLDLDETAFGVGGFKLNRQQVIGRVLLHTGHDALREQSNREGLVASDTFDALRRILMWVVHTEIRGLINEADDIELEERRAIAEDTSAISAARRRVENALDRLRRGLGSSAAAELDDLSKSVGRLTMQSQSLVARIQTVISEAQDERDKFVYLAGIGLMTEFIFHELERAVSYTIETISHGAVTDATLPALRDQLTTLHKRIAAFDEMSGEKRQTKIRFDVVDLVEQLLANHEREFERHRIDVCFSHPSRPVMIRAVRGMIIQIVENLIVNATYWLKEQHRFESVFSPRLAINIDADSHRLSIEDNGPGVISERNERIFQPFITTKPTGQGRGLGLYIAREMADYHGWRLYMDDRIGRVREGRINMFVLNMGPK